MDCEFSMYPSVNSYFYQCEIGGASNLRYSIRGTPHEQESDRWIDVDRRLGARVVGTRDGS
jgi:hypothetical protein